MTKKQKPAAIMHAPPTRILPSESCKHYQLYQGVREAVASLPVHFRTEIHISGVMATDLHTLNTALGAAIEEQVVRTLNLTRGTWDPDGKYPSYNFVRQAQTFPDVLLRKISDGDILMGIELKGWYLLSKETEPSLRFQATPDACAKQDLIVVVPWVLGNVISGSPILFEPFIESARYSAEYRNHYWEYIRQSDSDSGIEMPKNASPYPSKSDPILDKPNYDGGGNFGRLARTGLMDEYMMKLNNIRLCGIDTAYWREFLKIFRESTKDSEVQDALKRLKQRVHRATNIGPSMAQSTLKIIEELEQILELRD